MRLIEGVRENQVVAERVVAPDTTLFKAPATTRRADSYDFLGFPRNDTSLNALQ
jgi:hypothetical protein